MAKGLKKKTWIRITSFLVTGVVVLGAFSFVGFRAASRYRTNLEIGYKRAMEELSTYISNIENALNKGVYASTAPQVVGLSAKLLRETGCAKTCLSQMPSGDARIDSLTRFISQTGAFAMTLSHKAASGEAITPEDYDTLSTLESYAKQVNAQVQDMETELLSHYSTDDGVQIFWDRYLQPVENAALNVATNGFSQIEEGFTDYPTLIYDGPFSDHIMQRTALWTQGRSEVSNEVALAAAVNFTGAESNRFTEQNGEAGNLSTYSFSAGDLSIDITKQGGLVLRMIQSRTVSEQKIDLKLALENGSRFLQEHGIKNMKESYYSVSNNICTINFACEENGVTMYPDLIKVGVAMDNGAIVLYDATGYVMNHHARELAAPAITLEQAQQKLSPALSVVSTGLAVIPNEGLNEQYCYEFKCNGKDGDEVLVYISTQTGLEEQILILIKSENGILAY